MPHGVLKKLRAPFRQHEAPDRYEPLACGTRRSRASQERLEKGKEIAEGCRQELGHTSGDVTMKHYDRSRREQI